MTPKKCMSIAKSLTDTQHMELEPLCTVQTDTTKSFFITIENLKTYL